MKKANEEGWMTGTLYRKIGVLGTACVKDVKPHLIVNFILMHCNIKHSKAINSSDQVGCIFHPFSVMPTTEKYINTAIVLPFNVLHDYVCNYLTTEDQCHMLQHKWKIIICQ